MVHEFGAHQTLISASDLHKIGVRIGTILAVEDVAHSATAGAQVVADLTNSPSFEDSAVREFFETSGRNLRRRPRPASGAEVKTAATAI